MNPYQIIGIISCCAMIFAVVVAGLTMLGVPLLAAFLGVYLCAVWFMLGLQRRAQESSPEMQSRHSMARCYDHAILEQRSVVYNTRLDSDNVAARGVG